MPVFPLVGSTIVVTPGVMAPATSAASIIESPMRSFTLPPGLKRLELGDHGGPRLIREPRQS